MPNKINIEIKAGTKEDKKNLLRFYKNARYSAGFIGFDQSYLVSLNNDILSAAIVSTSIDETTQQTQYFLHALVSKPNHQRQGLATQLLQYIQEKHNPIVIFTEPNLVNFYQKRGFGLIDRTQLNTSLESRFNAYLKNKKHLTIMDYHQN